MNRTFTVGVLLTVGGTAGYVVGVATPYPGRALSLPGVMVGLALLTVGESDSEDRP